VKGSRALRHGPIADAEFDNPKMDNCPRCNCSARARETHLCDSRLTRRWYRSDFEDHPFTRYRFDGALRAVWAPMSPISIEIVIDDKGGRMFVCSDTDYARPGKPRGIAGSEARPRHKERPHG